METGELAAIIHAGMIGKFRTGAVTAVATKYFSPQNASSIGVYGAGLIAAGQLEALCAVRPINMVQVYSRTPKDRETFCRRMSEHLKIEVISAKTPEEAANNVDIIITASTSEVPVLSGHWLVRPGLVVAAGANQWYKREIDGNVIERSKLVVVDGMVQVGKIIKDSAIK